MAGLGQGWATEGRMKGKKEESSNLAQLVTACLFCARHPDVVVIITFFFFFNVHMSQLLKKYLFTYLFIWLHQVLVEALGVFTVSHGAFAAANGL